MTWIISKRAKHSRADISPEIRSLTIREQFIGYSGGSVRGYGDMPQVPAIVVTDAAESLRIEIGKDDQGKRFTRIRGLSDSLERLVEVAIAAEREARKRGYS